MAASDEEATFEGIANDESAVHDREREIADLLSFVEEEEIANVVWFTADIHYTAAHHYHPDRTRFEDFSPFWEFVAGPLNAGTSVRTNSTTPSARQSSTRRPPTREREREQSPAERRPPVLGPDRHRR